MIMQNTAPKEKKLNPSMTFDIKGSTVGRRIKFQDQNKFWL